MTLQVHRQTLFCVFLLQGRLSRDDYVWFETCWCHLRFCLLTTIPNRIHWINLKLLILKNCLRLDDISVWIPKTQPSRMVFVCFDDNREKITEKRGRVHISPHKVFAILTTNEIHVFILSRKRGTWADKPNKKPFEQVNVSSRCRTSPQSLSSSYPIISALTVADSVKKRVKNPKTLTSLRCHLSQSVRFFCSVMRFTQFSGTSLISLGQINQRWVRSIEKQNISAFALKFGNFSRLDFVAYVRRGIQEKACSWRQS